MKNSHPPDLFPHFAVLLRGWPVHFGLGVTPQGAALYWLLSDGDIELDEGERGRVQQRAEEELLRRQAWWREQHEARELRRRVEFAVGRRL